MEEDIKILEEMITWDCLLSNKRQTEAIENLINRNKELEDMLRNRIKYTNELEQDLFENASNYVIPKSLIKEKIEEYDKQRIKMEKDDIGVGFTLGKEWSDLKAKIQVLKELLEKEV